MSQEENKKKPLAGMRVIELGQLLAGPFCGRILAEFGAEVIKIEPPEKGDPLRVWRVLAEETKTSLWWYVQSRNKKSVTLDLNNPQAADIVKKLAAQADVVLENFKPGAMEKWGLGWEELKAINPRLIMTRISGWGQSGPYRDKPGYGSIGEAMGGIRYITGYPDLPPTRTGISLGDSLAGMWGAIGTMIALYNRDLRGGEGQVVDVALNEAVFALMESMLPEYSKFGIVRERTGSKLPGISPSNTYQCKDGKWIVIGGNGDSIFKRFMKAIGREDMANDPRFGNNNDRVRHDDILDEVISGWTAQFTYQEVYEKLDAAGVPVGPMYSIADIAQDPHFLARNMIQEAQIPGVGMLKIPGIIPQLSETPGETEWIGPVLGAHNKEIYSSLLGIDEKQLQEWEQSGLI